jgi:hypothetical protein
VDLTTEHFVDQLIRTVISCHWSFATVDNLEFKRMLQCLKRDITVPSTSTISRRVLELREKYEEEIRSILPPEPVKIAIALDCWSAPRREGYIAIKAYWITDLWRLAEALIGFEPVNGDHKGAALGEIVFRRLDHFGIASRISALTTDNASNNKTLTEALNGAIAWLNRRLRGASRIGEITQMPCLAHVLQLAVIVLTTRIFIAATNDLISKNWIEEDEIDALKDAMGSEESVNRVRIFHGSFMVVRLL